MCGVHWRQRPNDACRRRGDSSGCTSRKGGIGRMSDAEVVAMRLGEDNSAPRLAELAAERRDSEAVTRHAWQGQRPSGAPQRRPSGAP
jgi:hypothetical protein